MAKNKRLNLRGQFSYSLGSVINMFRDTMSQGMKNAQNQMQREQKELLKFQKSNIKNQQKQAKKAQSLTKPGELIDPNVYGQKPYPIEPNYNEDIIYGEDATLPAYEARKRSLYGGV